MSESFSISSSENTPKAAPKSLGCPLLRSCRQEWRV